MEPTLLSRRLAALRRMDDVPAEDLDALWADCTPVRSADILGSWVGSDFDTDHPVHAMLAASGWHGKRFDSVRVAHPLICRADDGSLFSNEELGRGLASLWDVEFRGEVTASMVYDGQPVIDHFKAVDAGTPPHVLLGVMNGKGVRHEGRHYYFVLEREA